MPLKILVVDDELLILSTVEKALTKVGYLVSTAQNIQELESALNNAPFDLMLTDIHMDDISVDNITEMIRSTSPEIRVMFMSGSSGRMNTDNFIEKPFKLDELREKVRICLNEPS